MRETIVRFVHITQLIAHPAVIVQVEVLLLFDAQLVLLLCWGLLAALIAQHAHRVHIVHELAVLL
jgi:hypothetical protein